MSLSKRRYLGVTLILAGLLAGCVSWPGNGVTYSPSRKLRIAVLPVRAEVDIGKLQSIESVPAPEQASADQAQRVRERLQTVTEEMTRSIETLLSASPDLEVVPHAQVESALAALGMPADKPLTAGQMERLGQALDVQAVLAVRLTGYGALKREWIVWLIGSGVGEGVAQGVVVARATANATLGVAAMLEEIGQEVLTWGGGSHLFNEHYSPVILEGRLVSAADGKKLWSDTAFSSIDKKALKKLPPDEQKKKQVQLAVTAEKTERDLVDDLEQAVKKHQSK